MGDGMALRRVLGVACLVALVCGCSGSGGSGDADRPRSGKPGKSAAASASASASGKAGGGRADVTFRPQEPVSVRTLERTAELIRDRAAKAGLGGVKVTVEDKNSITVSGPAARQETLEALGQPAELAFRPVLSATPETGVESCPDAVEGPSSEPLTACGESQDTVVTYRLGPVAVAGTDVSEAEAAYDAERGNGWYVNLDFTTAGGAKFADITGQLSTQVAPQNQFAIVLDGVVLSAPQVNGPITGGKAEISGSFTKQEAQQLAAQVNTGALPVHLSVSSVTKVRVD
jgi:preprotein translocase subunit SecD